MNIKENIEANKEWIDVKKTSNPDLFVLKYKRKVFQKGNWNEFLRECRGLVIDSNYNVICCPLKKIHNFRRENGAPEWQDSDVVQYARKINGFMVSATAYKGKLLVATTGSIDSDYAKLAEEWFDDELTNYIIESNERTPRTFFFECCDASDPHIINELPGLYYLGSRINVIGSKIDIMPPKHNWKKSSVFLVPVKTDTVANIKEMVDKCDHEGFVMYKDSEGQQEATKWKSPYYLVKKLFMRGNVEKLLSKNIKENIDEEYFELVDAIQENKQEFSAMNESERRSWIEKFLRDSK